MIGSRVQFLPAALAGLSHGQDEPNSTQYLIDPRTRFGQNYTLPVQDFPGLQSNWHPAPDPGEYSYVGHGRLKGRRALIASGDSGIGRAVAITFAREGADVAFNYLDEEESDAQTTLSFIKAGGQRAFNNPGDLRNETFCADLVQQAADRLGGLDIVVNNAGFALEQSYIGNHSTKSFEQTMRTNIYAPFFITRAAVHLLPPSSSIIFTASDLAARGQSGIVDYKATKAALVSFTRSLGQQLWPRGIRVDAVAPGPTISNFLTSQGATTEAVNAALPLLLAGRLAQPVELAPVYVDLAEGVNSYASGSVYGASGASGSF
ncbi:hypothetical protein QQZ08_007267 [Neonectria magnoliae]|uniref:Uncharacterized protein n=1 Tax=Neonectria magnoliae TaxID=2732573 RepID=A0ABR1HYG0_9HYPO